MNEFAFGRKKRWERNPYSPMTKMIRLPWGKWFTWCCIVAMLCAVEWVVLDFTTRVKM